MTLPKLHSLQDVADSMGVSTRWVRDRIREDKAAHTRLGNRIRFTDEQVAALVAQHAQQPVAQSLTTGRRRSA